MIEMKGRRALRRAWIVAVAGLVCTPLWAQAPTPKVSAATNQPKQPVDVTANHQDFYNDENKTVYTGDVEVIQGTDRLRTPRLTVFFIKKSANSPAPKPAAGAADTGERKIDHMEAEGPVYFSNPTQNGRGDHGVYTSSDQITVLTGNVVLVQGKDVSTGDKLIMNQATNQAQLFSGESSKRVRGVFYQDDAAKPAAGSPTSATMGAPSSPTPPIKPKPALKPAGSAHP